MWFGIFDCMWVHTDFCFKYLSHFQNLPAFCFNGYSTLLAPASEVLIPQELLSSKTVWTPDRELGKFSPYWPVSNYHFSGISLNTSLLNFILTAIDLSYDLPSYLWLAKDLVTVYLIGPVFDTNETLLHFCLQSIMLVFFELRIRWISIALRLVTILQGSMKTW